MRVLASILLVFFVAGCASIISKSDYTVSIRSAPQGANIKIYNRRNILVYEGTTPTTVSLTAHHGFFMGQKYRIVSSGSVVGQTQLNSRLDGWYLGNLIFGGLLGILIVDPATGAMWSLEEEVMITGQGQGSNLHDPAIRVVSIDDIPESLREKLIPLGSPSQRPSPGAE